MIWKTINGLGKEVTWYDEEELSKNIDITRDMKLERLVRAIKEFLRTRGLDMPFLESWISEYDFLLTEQGLAMKELAKILKELE